MKRKCLMIGIILLMLGVQIAPSINSSVIKAFNHNDLIEETNQIEKKYKVLGFGNIQGFYVNNVAINLRGYLYANISIINWESFPPVWGRHFIIINAEKREFFTAKTLPLYFVILNFRGYVNSKPYYTPHGPYGCGYSIFGTAENIIEI